MKVIYRDVLEKRIADGRVEVINWNSEREVVVKLKFHPYERTYYLVDKKYLRPRRKTA